MLMVLNNARLLVLSVNYFSVTLLNSIDLFHKWRPINYSFVFMKISPSSLVSMCKIQKNFYFEMRLVGLINIY